MRRYDIVVEEQHYVVHCFGSAYVTGGPRAVSMSRIAACGVDHCDAQGEVSPVLTHRPQRSVDVAVESHDHLDTVLRIVLELERSYQSHEAVAASAAGNDDAQRRQLTGDTNSRAGVPNLVALHGRVGDGPRVHTLPR